MIVLRDGKQMIVFQQLSKSHSEKACLLLGLQAIQPYAIAGGNMVPRSRKCVSLQGSKEILLVTCIALSNRRLFVSIPP